MRAYRGTLQDLFNVMGGMYAATLFIGVNNSSSVQPVVGVERSVFYREKGAGMYSALPYAIAQAAIEVPYTFVQAIVYALLVFSMYHFEWVAAKFLWFVYFTFLSFLSFTYYGMMCVGVTPSPHFGAIIASAFYGIWNLFSGFILPRTAIPIWWRWYYWATPVAWTIYGLIASQLGDLNTRYVVVPGAGPKIVSQYIEEYFGFHHSFLGVVAVMHVVFPALFLFVFAFSIKYLNFQRR